MKPKAKKKQPPRPQCPACHRVIPMKYKPAGEDYVIPKLGTKQIKFWRVHHYDQTLYKLTGVVCRCGYIISNINYKDYVGELLPIN